MSVANKLIDNITQHRCFKSIRLHSIGFYDQEVKVCLSVQTSRETTDDRQDWRLVINLCNISWLRHNQKFVTLYKIIITSASQRNLESLLVSVAGGWLVTIK